MEEKRYTREEIHRLVTSSYLDARQNERGKDTQIAFEISLECNIADLTNSLHNRDWKPAPPIVFIILDPTPREVFAPQFPDRTVSHIAYNLLAPLFERVFIYDSYSCRKDKGTLFGIERFEHHIRSVTDNYRYEAFILNLDISGYFMSIDRRLAYEIICDVIDRYKYRNYGNGKKWCEVIDFDFALYLVSAILLRDPLEGCVYIGDPALRSLVPPQKLLENSPKGIGLIIGDLMSQLISNIFLNVYDHYVKRVLHIRGYGRYVDDARLIHREYDYLVECKGKSTEFLYERLHLKVHPTKTTITSTRGTNYFLGAAVKDYRRYAKNETLARFSKAVDEVEQAILTGQMIDIEDTLSRMNSYLGYLQHFKERKFILKTLEQSPILGLYSLTPSCSKLIIKKQ